MEFTYSIAKTPIPEEIYKDMGITSEPGLQQLRDMEMFILRLPQEIASINEYILLFSTMLAQSLTKSLPGLEWGGEDEKVIQSNEDFFLNCKQKNGDDFRFYPFLRVMKFIYDPQNGLSTMFYMLEHISNYDIYSKEYQEMFVGDDGYVVLSEGVRFRYVSNDQPDLEN